MGALNISKVCLWTVLQDFVEEFFFISFLRPAVSRGVGSGRETKNKWDRLVGSSRALNPARRRELTRRRRRWWSTVSAPVMDASVVVTPPPKKPHRFLFLFSGVCSFGAHIGVAAMIPANNHLISLASSKIEFVPGFDLSIKIVEIFHKFHVNVSIY